MKNSNLLYYGVSSVKDEWLKQKIIITNFTACFLGLLSLPFTVVTLVLYTSVFWLPVIFLLTCTAILWCNYKGAIHFSRFLASSFLGGSYSVYHAYLLPDNEPSVGSLYSVQMLFWMVPWLVFDWREKKQLLLYSLLYTLISLLLPRLNGWFSLQADVSSFKNGALAQLGYFTALSAISGSLFFMSWRQSKTEQKSEGILSAMQQKQQQLQQNEAQMQQYLDEVKLTREESHKREWFNQGLARFADLLQNYQQDKPGLLYDKIVALLVTYLDINQGALFLQQEEQQLELVACYAYGKKKYIHQYIAPGEGLLGQAFVEQESICRNNIPNKYTSINSGIGQPTPTHLLIVPVKTDKQICGMLELAAFSPFEKYRIEFVEKAAENIAAALLLAKLNKKNQELIQEMQQTTIGLRVTEEELRQNLEELLLVQENMQHKEKEYLEQISLLKKQLEKKAGKQSNP